VVVVVCESEWEVGKVKKGIPNLTSFCTENIYM
jgi:hypothetical protein